MVISKKSRFEVRCSSSEKQLFQCSAKLQRLSLSEYVRRSLRMVSGLDDSEQLYQRRQQLTSRLLTDLRVVQALTTTSEQPQLHTAIARLLQVAEELRQ